MYTVQDVVGFLASQREQSTVVLATGVFDMLHQEHIAFLQKSAAVGDIFIVGVETDKRVKEMKGSNRPIHSIEKRVEMVKALGVATYVFSLPEQFSNQEDWEGFIATIRPDIYAVSSHTPYLQNKQAIMKKFGGSVVVVHEHNPLISTTQTLEQRKYKNS